jgi:hypothetical protein
MKKAVLVLTISMLLGGCATSSKVPKYEEMDIEGAVAEHQRVIISEEKKLNNRLVKAALLATEYQKILSETNNGLKRPMYDYDKIREARFQATEVPEGMERKLPIDWTGPVEPVLETIIQYSGYELVYKGIKPIFSRDVTLLPENHLTIKQHLDNIAVNSEGYIKDIDIYVADKKVVVIYENF